jgi:plastocyanin
LDRENGEGVAWSAGVQAGLPFTPIVFGLHASNTGTTTIEGGSSGTSRTRYGFELNAPVELAGFVFKWFTPRERARQTVTSGVDAPAAATVRIIGYAYTPAIVRIRAGEVVAWVNEDDAVHTVAAENGAFDSGAIRSGAPWRARFTEAGRYPYYCGPHPFMKGIVIVTAR